MRHINNLPKILALLALGSLLHITPAEEPQKLTLEKALVLAKEQNGELKQAILEYKKARAEADHALGDLFPKIGLSYDRTFSRSGADKGLVVGDNVVSNTTEFAGTVSWRVFDSGGRIFRLLTTRKSAEAQKQRTLFAVRKKLVEVSSDYIEVLKAQESSKTAQEQREDSKKILEQTEAAATAGQLPKKDVLQAKVSFLNADTENLGSKDLVLTNRATLKAILAIPSQEALPELTPLELSKDLQKISSKDELIKRGLEMRPDLIAQLNEIEAQKLRVQDEEIRSKVNLTLDASYTRSFSSGGFSGTSIMLGLNFPLLTPYLSQPLLTKQKLILESLQKGFDQSKHNAAAEIESTHNQLLSSLERLKSSSEALEAARQNYQTFLEAQTSHAATLVEVITARKSLFTAQTNYTQAFYDVLKTRNQLLLVTGQPVPGEE